MTARKGGDDRAIGPGWPPAGHFDEAEARDSIDAPISELSFEGPTGGNGRDRSMIRSVEQPRGRRRGKAPASHLVADLDQEARLVTRRLSFRDIFEAFRPMARVPWIVDPKVRANWGRTCGSNS